MRIKGKKNSRTGCSSRNRGYSLIEMAIAMVIVGLLIAPAASVYSTYMKHQQDQATTDNVNTVLTAIQDYRNANGVFPCPSGLNVARGAPTYGQAVLCTSADPLAAAPAFGACVNAGPSAGVCIEQSNRVTVPPLTPFQQRVIVGGVPFRQMQMDETKAYDGYGNRLVYVLTQSMADSATLSTLNGGISIQNPAGKSLINPPDSAVFAVISPGRDGVGGWTFDGAIHTKCTGATGADVPNCNPGFEPAGAASPTALLIDGYLSTATGANHYDDHMAYFQSQPDPLWRVVPGTTNIQDLTTKSVGVGVTALPATAPAIQLDVGAPTVAPVLSDLSVNTDALLVYGYQPGVYNGNAGKAGATKICDATGANCFDPIHIGGNNAVAGQGMKCAAGFYMAGIDTPGNPGTGGAHCLPVPKTCSGLSVMNGIVNGVPNCVLIPQNCLAQVMPICVGGAAPAGSATTVSLPATTSLSTTAPFIVNTLKGGCRSVRWTCPNTGLWSATPDAATDTSPTGALCGFTPVVTACNCSQKGANFQAAACPGNKTTNCGAAATDTRDYSACVCKAPTVTHPGCPAPWTGGTYTKTVSYSLPACAAGAPVNDFSTCTCSKVDPLLTFPACGPGYNTGGKTLTQHIIPGTCTYDAGTITANTCSCACPGGVCVQDVTVACPAPAVGTGTQHQVFNTTAGPPSPPDCAWDITGAILGCSCPATAITHPLCPAPPYDGTSTETVTQNYGAMPTCTPAVPIVDMSACACPVTSITHPACPAPALGLETVTQNYGPLPTCTPAALIVDKSACTCPANTSTPSACPAPFGSGTQFTNVSYGAAPSCTPTTTVDTTGCMCPATVVTHPACPAPFGAGTETVTQNYGPGPTCTPLAPIVDMSGCGCPAPVVTHPNCPAPWGGTETVTQDYGPVPTCTPLAPTTDTSTCTCDTTPQPSTRPHDCSGSSPGGNDCWSQLTPDSCTTTNVYSAGPPATCTVGSQVCLTDGTCQEGSWSLVPPAVDSGSGFSGPVPNGIDVGESCNCSAHQRTLNALTNNCSEPGLTEKFYCRCQ